MTKIHTVRELLFVKGDLDLYNHLKTVMLILKYKGLLSRDLLSYFNEALDSPASELEKVDMKWLSM